MNNVLISILNYNNFKSTKTCVESVSNICYDYFDILIIDNNSSDDSLYLLKKEFKNLTCLKSKDNRGYAAGHKIGVEYALEKGFNFIWILNNDLTVKEKSLNELILAYQKFGTGLYGSVTLKSENPDIINFAGGTTDDILKPLNFNFYEGEVLHKTNFNLCRKVQTIEGSSFLIPMDIIKKFGFMKEDFFMYAEEIDYCYRLNKFGIKSYVVKSSLVIHKGGESLKNKNYLEQYYRRRNFLIIMRLFYQEKVYKYITNKIGWVNFLKFLIHHLLKIKKENYYFNLGVLHALINKKGKLND